jgi:hypothetical protein
VHALLSLTTLEDVLSHPVAGPSWEGFVVENLLAATPTWAQPYFYRTSAGAEIDLVLELSATRRWAIEIKRSTSHPDPSKGFSIASDDIEAERRLVIYPGRRVASRGPIEISPLPHAMAELLALG